MMEIILTNPKDITLINKKGRELKTQVSSIRDVPVLRYPTKVFPPRAFEGLDLFWKEAVGASQKRLAANRFLVDFKRQNKEGTIWKQDEL